MKRLSVASVALLLACSRGGDTIPAVVLQQIADVRDAVAPPDGRLEVAEAPTRVGSTIAASWSLALTQPWAEYQAQLVSRFGARGYRHSGSNEQRSLFSKDLPGDTLSVVVEASGRPVTVRVTFTASPD